MISSQELPCRASYRSSSVEEFRWDDECGRLTTIPDIYESLSLSIISLTCFTLVPFLLTFLVQEVRLPTEHDILI